MAEEKEGGREGGRKGGREGKRVTPERKILH